MGAFAEINERAGERSQETEIGLSRVGHFAFLIFLGRLCKQRLSSSLQLPRSVSSSLRTRSRDGDRARNFVKSCVIHGCESTADDKYRFR